LLQVGVPVNHQNLTVLMIELHFFVVVTLGAQPDYLLLHVGGKAPAQGFGDMQGVDPART
jgi:hypothetical protein